MSGFLPLQWSTVDAWSRLTGHTPTHLEVEAMMALDGAMLFPEPEPSGG